MRTLSSTWIASSRVGSEDEGADARPLAGLEARRGRGEALQHGQHEGRRLAGAGLGAGEQVTAGEHERNRLALDGGGFGVALRATARSRSGVSPSWAKDKGICS